MMKKETQTIELTSKKLKLNKLFAGVIFIIGILVLMVAGIKPVMLGVYIGLFLAIIGFIWYIIIKIKIWWYHS